MKKYVRAMEWVDIQASCFPTCAIDRRSLGSRTCLWVHFGDCPGSSDVFCTFSL